MKEIYEFEKVAAGSDLINQNINPALYRAYFTSKHNNNDFIDFDWCFDFEKKDVQNIANNCKKYGVNEFTISDSSCNLIEILALFEKNGYYIKGMTSVKTTGDVSVPAILIGYINSKEK